MAQTTSAISWRECKIELSTNGTVWTDISGFANGVSVSGGDRDIGALKTLDGDTPILTAGKRNSLEVTVKAAYTEGVSDPTETARAAYEGATNLYFRWSPKNGQTGEFQYTTSAGLVKSPVYPQGNADSGDPVTVEIVINCASVTKAAAA